MNWMTFEGPTFRIDMPTTWLVKANQQFQAMFIAPKDEQDPIFPSFTIAITATDTDLKTHFETIEKLQTAEYPDYQVLTREVGANHAFRMYSWRYPASPTPLIQQQLFLMDEENNNVYTLTATFLQKQTQEFEPVFEAMMKSFNFRKL
jgi:hypothetical protein